VVRANSRRGEATLGGGGAVVNEQVRHQQNVQIVSGFPLVSAGF
jgi:hypothetical protein